MITTNCIDAGKTAAAHDILSQAIMVAALLQLKWVRWMHGIIAVNATCMLEVGMVLQHLNGWSLDNLPCGDLTENDNIEQKKVT